MSNRRTTAWLAAMAVLASIASAEAPRSTTPVLTVVTLGDSITKGVRTGVRPEETFAAIAERELNAKRMSVRVVNLGIGGERTDQALRRLDAVVEPRPRVVTVMYGTNDSYVDPGKEGSRITVEDYRKNLRAIVEGLLLRGIEPILMTEPRWAKDAPPNGLGENPNKRLAPYMEVCREVAKECRVRLVDHFDHWTDAESKGKPLRDWTTDGCHPNPDGHRELAGKLVPMLLETLKPNPDRVPFTTGLGAIREHDDNRVHPGASG